MEKATGIGCFNKDSDQEKKETGILDKCPKEISPLFQQDIDMKM
jgi:hypothetical protein